MSYEEESKLNTVAEKMEQEPLDGEGEGEGEDDAEENDPEEFPQEVIHPSKSKFDKFKEEVKKRESEGQKRIFPKVNVDRECDLKEVGVFEDYTVKLILHDLEFTSFQHPSKLQSRVTVCVIYALETNCVFEPMSPPMNDPLLRRKP